MIISRVIKLYNKIVKLVLAMLCFLCYLQKNRVKNKEQQYMNIYLDPSKLNNTFNLDKTSYLFLSMKRCMPSYSSKF